VRVDAEKVGVDQGLGADPSVLRGDIEAYEDLRHEAPEVIGGVAGAVGGHAHLLCGAGTKITRQLGTCFLSTTDDVTMAQAGQGSRDL